MLDAMADMVAQNIAFNPVKGGLQRVDLGNHVYAVSVLVHHLGETADLALDAVETLANGGLDVISHHPNIPP